MSLTRDAFFAKPTLAREEVKVPALGGTVFVRVMTAGERDRYDVATDEASRADVQGSFRARVTAFTACDENGKLLFTEDDIPGLAELPCSSFDPIVMAAMRLNRMTAEEVEGLEKNSDGGPEASSATV